MTVSAQLKELKRLIEHLSSGLPATHGAIPWAAPVPMFGSLCRSRIATLGLNPSNLEFVDQSGAQLDRDQRRLHSLSSLGLRDWGEAQKRHIRRVWEFCDGYFQRNPY